MDTNKTSTRTRTKLSTFGTNLRSVIRSNPNNFNSFSFSFVLDKTLQLKETPVANPIIHSLASSDISYSFEVFHYNFISVKFGDNFLADVMINPSHETSFFSRQLFQEPSGTSSAFSLEFTSQEFEFPFNLLDFGGMKELPVRSDSEIIYSQVHTQNSVRTRTHGAFLGECEHEKAFAFVIDSQKAFINFPAEIIFETIGNSEGNFDPSFDCGNTQNVIFEREASWSIISNRTEFNNWFGFSFLNNSTRLFDAGNGELRRQSNFLERRVNKRMQFDIIPNFQFPSLVNTKLQSSFVNFNSFNNLRSCFNSNFSGCSGSHGLLTNSIYLNLLEGISPPNPEGIGYPKCTVI